MSAACPGARDPISKTSPWRNSIALLRRHETAWAFCGFESCLPTLRCELSLEAVSLGPV
jgi:hypothetical protein